MEIQNTRSLDGWVGDVMEKDLAPKMIDRALGFFTIKAMKILSSMAPSGDMLGAARG
jgi:hypothetical protein